MSKKYCILQWFCNFGNIRPEWQELVAGPKVINWASVKTVHLNMSNEMSKTYCILQPFCNVGQIPPDWHELVATGSFISKCQKNIVFYSVFATSATSHRSATSSLQPDLASQKVNKVLYFTCFCSFCPIELATPNSPKLKNERRYQHQAQIAKPNLPIQLAEA